MAQGADVTDPQHMVLPPDVQAHPINDVVVAITYNTEILEVDRSSINILKATGRSADLKGSRAEQAHIRFMAELRKYTAMGLYILIRGWFPDRPLTWNVESIQAYKGSADQCIEYQGNLSHFLIIGPPVLIILMQMLRSGPRIMVKALRSTPTSTWKPL